MKTEQRLHEVIEKIEIEKIYNFAKTSVGRRENQARDKTVKLERAQGECLGTGSRRKT